VFERTERKAARLLHQKGIFVAGFFGVWHVSGGVDPEPLELRQPALIPHWKKLDISIDEIILTYAKGR
jgi:hypothetical protein